MHENNGYKKPNRQRDKYEKASDDPGTNGTHHIDFIPAGIGIFVGRHVRSPVQ